MAAFKKVKNEKFAQEVANQIKQSIFDGTYSAGDRLPNESEMAQLFGVSRMSVRQAIRVLENTGMVHTRQGAEGGIFVSEADTLAVSTYLSDMLKLKRVTNGDLTMARLIFEPYIAHRVAALWQGDDLEGLEENLRQAVIKMDQNELETARLLNLTFHRLICSLTQNPVINFTLNSVIDVLEENILKIKLDPGFVRQEIVSHSNILEAIRARNGEEARDLMHEHVETVHKGLAAASTTGDHNNKEQIEDISPRRITNG